MEDLDDLIAGLLQADAQGLCSILMEEAEQEMLGADIPVPEPGGLTAGHLREADEVCAHRSGAGAAEVDAEAVECSDGHALLQAGQTRQQVIGGNAVMPLSPCFPLSQVQRLPSTSGQETLQGLMQGRLPQLPQHGASVRASN
ncbi:hypothetical protein Acor_65840 [Acrocarpospora corrugata]|uniref:Uncharacterized protein n=1 Tax=Acrocarpospora corrugata TaxID=35763 RepID=A0A5M3W6V0_9ACTN|nr:hypothetical protein Acor_65840 [Acrocarpospora corrugata]